MKNIFLLLLFFSSLEFLQGQTIMRTPGIDNGLFPDIRLEKGVDLEAANFSFRVDGRSTYNNKNEEGWKFSLLYQLINAEGEVFFTGKETKYGKFFVVQSWHLGDEVSYNEVLKNCGYGKRKLQLKIVQKYDCSTLHYRDSCLLNMDVYVPCTMDIRSDSMIQLKVLRVRENVRGTGAQSKHFNGFFIDFFIDKKNFSKYLAVHRALYENNFPYENNFRQATYLGGILQNEIGQTCSFSLPDSLFFKRDTLSCSVFIPYQYALYDPGNHKCHIALRLKHRDGEHLSKKIFEYAFPISVPQRNLVIVNMKEFEKQQAAAWCLLNGPQAYFPTGPYGEPHTSNEFSLQPGLQYCMRYGDDEIEIKTSKASSGGGSSGKVGMLFRALNSLGKGGGGDRSEYTREDYFYVPINDSVTYIDSNQFIRRYKFTARSETLPQIIVDDSKVEYDQVFKEFKNDEKRNYVIIKIKGHLVGKMSSIALVPQINTQNEMTIAEDQSFYSPDLSPFRIQDWKMDSLGNFSCTAIKQYDYIKTGTIGAQLELVAAPKGMWNDYRSKGQSWSCDEYFIPFNYPFDAYKKTATFTPPVFNDTLIKGVWCRQATVIFEMGNCRFWDPKYAILVTAEKEYSQEPGYMETHQVLVFNDTVFKERIRICVPYVEFNSFEDGMKINFEVRKTYLPLTQIIIRPDPASLETIEFSLSGKADTTVKFFSCNYYVGDYGKHIPVICPANMPNSVFSCKVHKGDNVGLFVEGTYRDGWLDRTATSFDNRFKIQPVDAKRFSTSRNLWSEVVVTVKRQ